MDKYRVVGPTATGTITYRAPEGSSVELQPFGSYFGEDGSELAQPTNLKVETREAGLSIYTNVPDLFIYYLREQADTVMPGLKFDITTQVIVLDTPLTKAEAEAAWARMGGGVGIGGNFTVDMGGIQKVGETPTPIDPVVAQQAERIAAQDNQIAMLGDQMAAMMQILQTMQPQQAPVAVQQPKAKRSPSKKIAARKALSAKEEEHEL